MEFLIIDKHFNVLTRFNATSPMAAVLYMNESYGADWINDLLLVMRVGGYWNAGV